MQAVRVGGCKARLVGGGNSVRAVGAVGGEKAGM